MLMELIANNTPPPNPLKKVTLQQKLKYTDYLYISWKCSKKKLLLQTKLFCVANCNNSNAKTGLNYLKYIKVCISKRRYLVIVCLSNNKGCRVRSSFDFK